MRAIVVGVLLLLAPLGAGCATTQRAPSAQLLTLGKWKAEFRDYAGLDVCRQDGARLAQELEGMNAVLAEFLQNTAAGYDGVWADEHLAILEEGRQKLSPVLAAYEPLVKGLQACEYPEELGLADLVRSGTELARQSGKRIVVAESMGTYARARQDLDAWRDAQPNRIASAKSTACGQSRKATIFYASEEDGKTAWYFCDGARAVRGPNGITLSAADPRKKAPKRTKAHVDAVEAYPGDLIVRAPKAPARPTEKAAKPDDVWDLNAPFE